MAGILSDMMAGAAESAGSGLGKMGIASILKDQEALIQQERDARLREWKNQDTIAAEKREPGNRAAVMAAETPEAVSRAQQVSDINVGAHEKTAKIDSLQRIEEFKALAPLKRKDMIDTEVSKLEAMSTPEALKAQRAIKQAQHIVDPTYAAVPELDGSVTLYDTHSGKTKKMLGEDGKPIMRKDPEELKAATSVINMANMNLKIAEAAYKASKSDISLDPVMQAAATTEWKNAQEEARRLSAPAYAVLYKKAGLEDVPKGADTSKTEPPPKPGDVVDGYVFKGGDYNNKKNWKAAPQGGAAKPRGASLYGSSGTHGLIESYASESNDSQKRISELQDRLDNNVNTTLEGKRRDETELQMLLSKRNARYQPGNTYDPNKPAIWDR